MYELPLNRRIMRFYNLPKIIDDLELELHEASTKSKVEEIDYKIADCKVEYYKVKNALKQLTDEERELLELKYEMNVSYRLLGEHYGVSPNVLNKRVFKIMGMLGKLI